MPLESQSNALEQRPAGPPAPIVPQSYEEGASRFLSAVHAPDEDTTDTETDPDAALKPKKDDLVKSIVKGAKSIVTHPGQSLTSAGRGVGDALSATARTLISVTGQLSLDKKDREKSKKTADEVGGVIDRATDSLFGPRSAAPSQQFVEDTANFISGFVGAGKFKFIARLGPIVKGLAAGAVADFAAFDPYRAQLAELAAQTHIVGLKDLGQLLSVSEDDGPIAARMKRSFGGLIPGAAIDGLVASARFFKGAEVLKNPKATPAAKQAAEQAVRENGKILQDISDGNHVPNEPVVVKPTSEGTWTLEARDEAELEKLIRHAEELSGERQRVRKIIDKQLDPSRFAEADEAAKEALAKADAAQAAAGRPDYDSRWMAEAQAASINEAFATRMTARAVVDKSKMAEVFDLAKKIEAAGDDPDKIVQLVTEARFNFTYMDPPEKVESLLKAVGEVLSPAFDKAQGRPSIPLSESVDRSLQLAGMLTRDDAPDYLRNVSAVLKNTDANVLLMNSRLMELGEQVAKWSSILDDRPLDAIAEGEARRALQAYANFASDVAGSNSGVGRGLNALKERGNKALKDMKFKGEEGAAAAPAAGDLGPDIIAGMTSAELRDVSRLFRQTKEPRVLFNTLASELKPQNMGRGAKFGRGMLEFFYNSVLSAPATHAAIFLANGTVNAIEDGVRLLAGTIRRDPEMIREAADLLQGRLIYTKQSLKGMVMAFKAGHSIIDPRPIYRAIPGIGGEVIRTLGTRPISAVDEFWRVNSNLAFVRMNSLKLARRDASAKGLTGDALDKFVSTRVEADVHASLDPASGASRLPAAREFAALPTFSSPLKEGSFGSSLETLVQEHPWLVPVVPFVRTSINVIDYTFAKSSPLGLFSKSVRESISSGTPEGAIMATRIGVGTTVWGGAGLLAFSGDITGHGPSDPKLRKMWLASHQPYSVKIGDEWVSYRRLDPFSTPLSVMADLAQILRDNADDLQVQEDGSKVFYGIIAATVSGMTNKTYLNGLVEFMDAIGSASPNRVKNFADGLVSTAVPNALQLANSDPYMRETQRMFDALVNRVPGWSQSLPAKYNVFGEPVTLQPSKAHRVLNPLPFRDGTPMVEDEILQLNRAFTAPPTVEKFGEVSVNLHDRRYANKTGSSLTPYERMMELVNGLDLRGQVEKIIDSDAYRRAGDGTDVFAGGRRYRELQDRIERVYDKARKKMLSEYPDLARELKGLDRAKRASVRSDDKGESILERIR